MFRRIHPLLLAIITLAACSHDNDPDVITTSSDPVAFNSYVGTPITRAGITGSIDTRRLQQSADGFGVFAYYTGAEPYASATAPNFMWNQQVRYDDMLFDHITRWSYSPLKFWPNEVANGSVDDQTPPASTTATNGGRISFFAYAPYVAATPATGVLTGDASVGITSLSSNTLEADPTVAYTVAARPNQSVDLLWGVVGDTPTGNIFGDVPVASGLPWRDMTKQTTQGKLDILFRHALAQIRLFAYLEIDNIENYTGWDGVTPWRETTKFTIKDITISSSYLDASGVLNLNNTVAGEPRWDSRSGNVELHLDGSNLPTYLADPLGVSPTGDDVTNGLMGNLAAAAGESVGSDIVAKTEAITGVTDMAKLGASGFTAPLPTRQNRLSVDDAQGNEQAFMIIPSADPMDDYTITVHYYVTTYDPKLLTDPAGYSRVENTISRRFRMADADGTATGFLAGRIYYLGLGLGMTTVKFSVYGADWNAANGTIVPLPANVISENGTSPDQSLAPRRKPTR